MSGGGIFLLAIVAILVFGVLCRIVSDKKKKNKQA
jgi:hypothetical protein